MTEEQKVASEPNRRALTFAQAEGVEPLPSQLELREVSKELRALLWDVFYMSMFSSQRQSSFGPNPLGEQWTRILRDWHVNAEHRFADEFNPSANIWIAQVKAIFANQNYIGIFEFLQFAVRHPARPPRLRAQVEQALTTGRAAYHLVEDTIFPKASDEEAAALAGALSAASHSKYGGAHSHLRAAGTALSKGDYAGSVRESISAVESLARSIEPGADKLGQALAKLEAKGTIHGGLKSAFASLYGYTSDSEGVRHALVLQNASTVDETDAIFMLGACASFVSYVIARADRE